MVLNIPKIEGYELNILFLGGGGDRGLLEEFGGDFKIILVAPLTYIIKEVFNLKLLCIYFTFRAVSKGKYCVLLIQKIKISHTYLALQLSNLRFLADRQTGGNFKL